MRAVLGHEIIRSRKTAAEPIDAGFKAPNELMLSISSKPDSRLIALVQRFCSTTRMIGLRVNDA